MSKSYRNGDAIGNDYKCSGCGLHGYRLWRQTHTYADNIELLCHACGTVSERENIKRSMRNGHPDVYSTNLGYLVPARPTPEGDTFWGHTSGDVEWWYELPQHQDAAMELALVRRERAVHRSGEESYGKMYVDAAQAKNQAERDLRCQIEAHKPAKALAWRRALEDIERVNLEGYGRKPDDDIVLGLRLIADRALRS